MTTRHKTGQLTTFPEREDTTLPAGNPMTTPTTYAALSPAVPALALLSAWLAARCSIALVDERTLPPRWPAPSAAGAAGARCTLRAP